MKSRFTSRLKVVALALPMAFLWAITGGPATASAAVIADGTVMVGTGNGDVTEFTQSGVILGQLNTMTGSTEESGSAFDSSGNFFVTDFEGNQITKFDPSGNLIGPFGSGYNMHPESIAFDASGHVFVGQGDGTTILEFASLGNPITSFSPVLDARGTDWIELAADNCTIFYTSEGTLVKRFNVCTSTQLPDFNTAPLPGAAAYAHRILLPFQFGAGGVLVADTDRVVRLDSSGAQVQSYTLPGATFLFALNLDPDGTSFWTADLNSGQVYKLDIQSGTILQNWSGKGEHNFDDVAGLSVKGELTAPLPPPDCSMAAASDPLLWPPNHKFQTETVLGVTAVNGPVTVNIDSIFQDEAPTVKGSGHTCQDGKGVGTSTALVRSERSGQSDGRVYHIGFTATDTKNQTCTGEVTVCVPHDQGEGQVHGHAKPSPRGSCIDEGPIYDSTVCP